MILFSSKDSPLLKLVMSRSRVRIPSSALISISYKLVKQGNYKLVSGGYFFLTILHIK